MEGVIHQFMACVPLKDFNWNGISYTNDCQQEIMQKIFKISLICQYPPSVKYQFLFMKTLMKKIEDSNYDIIEEIYEVLGDLVSTSSISEYSYRSYYLGAENGYVTLKESVNLISEGATGLHTWQAAFCLAEWAIENKDIFQQRRIVEIGAGCGFLGIIISKVNRPSSCLLTDYHSDVLKLLQENTAINISTTIDNKDSPTIITTAKLNWLDPDSFIENMQCDVIIGSDIVYDNDLTDSLVEMLRKILKMNPKIIVLIACTIRNMDTFDHFTDTLACNHINYIVCQPTTEPIFYYDRSLIMHILKLFA